MFGAESPGTALAILNGLQTGLYVVDLGRHIVFWNDGAERITGLHRQEVIGRHCGEDLQMHCDTEGANVCGEDCPLAATLRDGKVREAELFVRHRCGHRVAIFLRSQAIHNERGEIIAAGASFELQSLLHRTDPMLVPADARCSLNERTGLPDHEFTIAYVQAKLKRFAGHNLPFAILRIELDGLADLLARHGVDAAHAMLLPLANTLKNTLRPSDYLGVWGEYQFVAVMNSMSGASPEELAQRLRRIAATASIQWWGDRLAPAIRVETTTARTGDTMESLLERIHAGESEGPHQSPENLQSRAWQ